MANQEEIRRSQRIAAKSPLINEQTSNFLCAKRVVGMRATFDELVIIRRYEEENQLLPFEERTLDPFPLAPEHQQVIDEWKNLLTQEETDNPSPDDDGYNSAHEEEVGRTLTGSAATTSAAAPRVITNPTYAQTSQTWAGGDDLYPAYFPTICDAHPSGSVATICSVFPTGSVGRQPYTDGTQQSP